MKAEKNMIPHLKSIMMLSAMCLMLPITAQAQFSRNGNAPIEADADDIVNSAGVTVLSGQVDVRQGDTRILSDCLLYTSPSPRDQRGSRMPSSA